MHWLSRRRQVLRQLRRMFRKLRRLWTQKLILILLIDRNVSLLSIRALPGALPILEFLYSYERTGGAIKWISTVLIITGIRMPVLVKGMVPEMFFDPGHIFFRCEMGIIAVAPNLSVGVHLPDLHCLAAALKHFIQG